MSAPAPIVILDGPPRSGKTSIARAMQAIDDRPWMNIGVDAWLLMASPRFRPGIGLRPGGERPELERLIPAFYLALYGSIAEHSRCGIPVVADFGHHTSYATGIDPLPACLARLNGLPKLLVRVRCSLETMLARRELSGAEYETSLGPVERWQHHADGHAGLHDMVLDTDEYAPETAAAVVLARVAMLETDAAFRHSG